ncbi:hypothetical protein DM02DRAFT_249177 [Periconia macrospinosa]|uniref:Uncharacterized protein n=1 Tax=Periconia macrospinosa TaxID=97972 RepID=A0A2V1D544_9PLEO|nr:hypothetical protein DM02DRAFT_249177 [Periconia macrospinosa]
MFIYKYQHLSLVEHPRNSVLSHNTAIITMKLDLFLTISIGSTLTLAARRVAPAVYHRDTGPERTLIKDQYAVKLHDHHTLQAHFKHIGVNLSESNLGRFEYHEGLNFYVVRIDERTMHELIRYDPGVKYVQHDAFTFRTME